MNNAAILIVPCCEEGRGGGHINRCIALANNLRSCGREAFFFLQKKTKKINNLLQLKNFNESWVIDSGQINRPFGLVILDRFQTPHDELLFWKKLAPVIGIDEGGPSRDYFDFLIDILIPNNFEKPSANITSCCLLDLPKKTKSGQDVMNTKLKILISFGQEDAAGLGLSAVKKLAKSNLKEAEITLLRGGLNYFEYQIPSTVKVLDFIPNLMDRLHEYDIVITHYGITAYEALYAGTTVLLDHPTPYHKKLAKAAGFPGINQIKNFTTNLTNPHEQQQASGQQHLNPRSRLTSIHEPSAHPSPFASGSCGSWLKIKEPTLPNLINSFSPQVNRSCPVCGADTQSRSLARFPERTYRRCTKCGAIYMDRTCPPPIEYEKEYFFESYKKQYGKTYLEDFPNLVAMAKRRLRHISQRLHTKSTKEQRTQREEKSVGAPLLLDIGCAYGPFLVAAKEEGFSPSGIDPAVDAVRYVQETLNIPAVQGFFPNCKLPTIHYPLSTTHYQLPTPHSPLYDVITLWYVIEHFRDCTSVLIEIKKLLKPGGILAFSTPSFSGVSGRKSLRKFLENSPADHFTIWSPKTCKKALTLAGFKVKKIVISGCHPERFPLIGKFAKNKKSLLYWLLLAVSKIFNLGDTFEVYAQKNSTAR
jgi:2-polyprenyl-3-methyl-5-hydroxy-6-metoxy-1,4-benzoquinol methylase/spore coat polysaccharide biosynthesis predicted glycosyltransferase SpsG